MSTTEKAPFLMPSSAKQESSQNNKLEKSEPWTTEKMKSNEESPSNQLESHSIMSTTLPTLEIPTRSKNISST
jgi:hypothetical protein